MKKYKYLLKNIGLLTISNFATKLLSFFLVPIYTSVLTTGQYGTYDLFNTTIGVLIPILTINAVEFVLRYSLDKSYNQNAVVTIGAKWMLVSSLVVIIFLVVNNIFGFIPLLQEYSIFFFWMYFSQALSGIMTSYARGSDHVAALSVSSVIASAITIFCNILFLIPLKMGLPGYFWANIIGPLFQCVYLVISMKIWKNMQFSANYAKQEKEMLKYSLPMIANSISWWINSVSDRYVVTWFCGIAANGIYSISNKIPSILSILQTIFNQAWTLSAVKDFDPNDESGFFANTYKIYNCILVIGCSLVIASDRILASFIYAKAFYSAWKYVPFLTIAVLFNALVGYLGGFFTAVKDSKAYAIASIVGAISNVVLNLILVPKFGTIGAAFSTAVSYIEAWIIRLIQSRKYVYLKINIIRDCVSYMLLIAQSVILLIMPNNAEMYLIQLILIVTIISLYGKDMDFILRKILRNQFN